MTFDEYLTALGYETASDNQNENQKLATEIEAELCGKW